MKILKLSTSSRGRLLLGIMMNLMNMMSSMFHFIACLDLSRLFLSTLPSTIRFGIFGLPVRQQFLNQKHRIILRSAILWRHIIRCFIYADFVCFHVPREWSYKEISNANKIKMVSPLVKQETYRVHAVLS